MNTSAIISPIVHETYGKGSISRAAVQDVAALIDNFDPDEFGGHGRSREERVMLRLWDWFSGGTTAESTASKIESALREHGR